jgi:hypothetical protein
MYGIKMDKENGTYEVFEGSKEELTLKGCVTFYEDERSLKSGIHNVKYHLNRAKFNHLSIEQLQTKSEEILSLERKVFGVMEDYEPGIYISRRISALEKITS